jgi:hypothetical protein
MLMSDFALFQRAGVAGLSVLAAVFLSQCASTVERRIEKNPAVFASLSPADQELVRGRKLREGMGKDAVFLAVGRPDRVSMGRKSGKEFERWTYVGTQSVMTQTIGMGFGGWGGFGGCGPFYDPFFMGGPMVTYVPYEAASVDFVDGKVVGWETSPRR